MTAAGYSDAFSGAGGMTAPSWWGYQITQPLRIEFPRSMVQVVIAWNVSMHNWLKICKFF